jgi:Tfp pilus assembly protein PilV
MIDTHQARLPDPRSQRGDTLIEVVISAMLLAVIVVGTLTGLNSANRATSEDRARSQADVLAQQEEEQFRSLPVEKLSELSVTHETVVHEVNASGTKYVISSTAKYIDDATATSSCNASTPNANYIQTTSEVTWKPLGNGKPVVETSIISPPPDAAIIARVTNAAGEPVPGMTVVSSGPSDISTSTSSDGCAILAAKPGEYSLNVYKPGYVDQNGFSESKLDTVYNTPFYVAAEESVKIPFQFDAAGTLEVTFQNPSNGHEAEGDTFVVANTGMNPAYKYKGQLGTYSPKVSSGATLFPFTTQYNVYAGSCEADNPHIVNSANTVPHESVKGGEVAQATVAVPLVNIQVMSGTSGTPGSPLSGATGVITDTGCHTERPVKTESNGGLEHPNLPFGKYNLCLEHGGKLWEHEFSNRTTTGPTEGWTGEGAIAGATRIYFGSATKTGVCP